MLFVIYLVIISFITIYAQNAENSCTVLSTCCAKNENSRIIQYKLEEVERLIKSAKEKLPTTDTQDCSLPMDCEDVLESGQTKSGVYFVWPKSRISPGPLAVYCDMTTDGGGWTVIQRRGDFQREKEYFHKDWNSYRKGFGNIKEDFWLGNDNIYALSNQRLYSIRFDLGSVDGTKAFAFYNKFWIDDEYNAYRLHIDGYKGDAGDSMTIHNEMKFSTHDRDNDLAQTDNCAARWRGGWWFENCHPSNLNGNYFKGTPPGIWQGIIWRSWKGNNESLTFTEMKIRRAPAWLRTDEKPWL